MLPVQIVLSAAVGFILGFEPRAIGAARAAIACGVALSIVWGIFIHFVTDDAPTWTTSAAAALLSLVNMAVGGALGYVAGRAIRPVSD